MAKPCVLVFTYQGGQTKIGCSDPLRCTADVPFCIGIRCFLTRDCILYVGAGLCQLVIFFQGNFTCAHSICLWDYVLYFRFASRSVTLYW